MYLMGMLLRLHVRCLHAVVCTVNTFPEQFFLLQRHFGLSGTCSNTEAHNSLKYVYLTKKIKYKYMWLFLMSLIFLTARITS